MAQVEPMDIDAIESDFDNKENAFQFNNVLSRTPCTEKGYEELDVSELNMKLRYSITPASSPMSKSLTGPCLDNRNFNSEDYFHNAVAVENGNLTHSLNSTLTKTEGQSKSKVLPLQTLTTDLFIDSNRNSSMHSLLEPTDNNVIISVNNANEIEENLSLPSTCSSVPDTPEATTPTKEVPKPEGSPILRGLKSVLSIFRPSQSPILPTDDKSVKPDIVSPIELNKSKVEIVQTSTPEAENKQKDANSSKRSSPLKDSLVFNDDLERELLWKDETTIIFKEERIPVHKLFFQNPITTISTVPKTLNATVEHMDTSCDESIIVDKINKNIEPSDLSFKHEHAFTLTGESDNEFLDCETTFTKNESCVTNCNNLEMGKEIHIIGNVTGDLSNNAEILREVNSESTNISKKPNCVTTGDITVSVTNVSPKIYRTNIIEATINLLHSECIDYSKSEVKNNIDLQNKPQLNMKLQDPNMSVTLEEHVIKDHDLIKPSEAQPLPTSNMENNFTTSNNLKGEEMKESEDRIYCGIDKLSNDNSYTIGTKQQNDIVDDMTQTVNNIDTVRDFPASDNTATNIERIKGIGYMPNIDEPNMINKLTSTQLRDLESNTELLISIEDITVPGEIPEKNKTFTGAISNNIESILNEDDNVIKDITETQTVKDEYNVLIQTGSEILVGNKNSNSIANNIGGILDVVKLVSYTTKGDDHMPNASILPSLKDLVNPINSLTVKSDLNGKLNANKNNIENILEVKKESFPPENNADSETYVTPKIDDNMLISDFVTKPKPPVNKVSDSDRQDRALIIKSNTVVSKSPSEIPLPDEEDADHNILENIDMYNEDCNKQSTHNVCGTGSIMNVENDLVLDYTKCDLAKITSNHIEENGSTSVMNTNNEHNSKITVNKFSLDKDANCTLTCITQYANEHIIEAERDKAIVPEEYSSKDICIPQETYINVDQDDSPKTQVNENMVNKIVKDEFPSNIEQNSSITEIVDKCEQTNQVKIDDDINEDFVLKKGIHVIDEEIIISANNSPYVSVTDFDKVVEKLSSNTLEEINNQFATNTTLTSSPPISPKIVSKGYNFNFDEIDDPFATKTKIRMSPTSDTPSQSLANVTKEIKTLQEVPKKLNKRKSQSARTRVVQKKNMNSTFSDKLPIQELTSEKHTNSTVITSMCNVLDNISTSHMKDDTSKCKTDDCATTVVEYDKTYQKINDSTKSVTLSADEISTSILQEEIQSNEEEIKNNEQNLITEKSTSSSEQYFSLGTSSGENSSIMNRSKNVFNLPEIDDVNFNPFATKSKMGISPPPLEIPTSSSVCTNDISKSSFVMQQQSDENNTLHKYPELMIDKNIRDYSVSSTSNTTCSSKSTNDIDTTVREILTEDEDTVEGPFLELDELRDTQNVSDVNVEADMMNFKKIPQQDRDENLENGELFIDADAFEFLLNQNKSTTVLDSGKESLFLKFDPLFAKRISSDGILAALSKVQKRQSTPKKVITPTQIDLNHIEKSTAGPSNNKENCGLIEGFNEDLSSTATKPMMVVNPAVSSIITQKKCATPKLNRRSLTFTSPAMAVIDRLLSLSGNSSHLENDVSIPGREHTETDLAITQLRELLAEKEINVHSLRCESKELKDRLAALEVQVKGLETESAVRLAKINELNEKLLEKTKMNKSMAIVVEEYERTIASLIAETEHDKKRNFEERMRLIRERDEQTAHLTSMEVSFSDLHSKYEKSKQIILSCKANEDIYKKSIKDFQDNFSKMQNNYELLKQHATSKLNHANQELEKMNRAHEAEVLKMNAMIKRKDLHISSLEETLAQKTKANEELTAICDELINKVG